MKMNIKGPELWIMKGWTIHQKYFWNPTYKHICINMFQIIKSIISISSSWSLKLSKIIKCYLINTCNKVLFSEDTCSRKLRRCRSWVSFALGPIYFWKIHFRKIQFCKINFLENTLLDNILMHLHFHLKTLLEFCLFRSCLLVTPIKCLQNRSLFNGSWWENAKVIPTHLLTDRGSCWDATASKNWPSLP